jgi:hypothetical protein
MRKLYSFTLALMTLTLTLTAQKEGLNYINKSDMKAYMSFFASDEMKGRETGSRENEIAALYLRTNLMRLGLKPLTGTDDYLQQLPLVSSEIKSKETYLKISDNNGNAVYSTDSLIYLMAPFQTTDVTASFVFAGYGYEDTTTGYNDLKDVNLKDKIVLIMTGRPQNFNSEELNSVFDMNLERIKLMSVFHQGAKVILYAYDPAGNFPDAYTSGLADMGADKVGSKMFSLINQEDVAPIQVAFITHNTADMLLKTSGYNLKQLQEKIIAGGKSVSLELKGITATFRTYIEKNNLVSNNVIGIVEGSDPVLRNECVIYTAHFDHVGVSEKGEVYNGADDNASGSMALLEVAEAFINLKKKPLRTIVFAWVNGEEKGLLGSQYYTEKPLFPLGKTLLDINLDMVGRSKMPSDTGKVMGYDVSVSQPGEILLYTDQTDNDLLKIVTSTSEEAGISVTNMGIEPVLGSSDYASFMAKGVPALFFNSGDYPDLHTVRDDIDKIDFDKMERVSEMVYLIGYKIANQRERFKPANTN